MKIALLYFTGTYNTLFLTTLMKNRLMYLHHQVDVFLLTDNLKFSYKKYDRIGIGYPIHAFNAPKIVEKNLEKLKIEKSAYFIYKSSGEPFFMNNASSYKIYKIMKARQNVFFGEYHFVMPYNILFKTKEEFIGYEMQYNLKYIKYLCDHLMQEKTYKVSLLERFISFVFKIQRLGCKVNIKFYKVNKKKCIRCQKCIINCPTHNLRYHKNKKKIVFDNHCVMCMRCSFQCPTNAISIGLLNHSKVNGSYDFNQYLFVKSDYQFSTEKKWFYRKFKSYFDAIDSLSN